MAVIAPDLEFSVSASLVWTALMPFQHLVPYWGSTNLAILGHSSVAIEADLLLDLGWESVVPLMVDLVADLVADLMVGSGKCPRPAALTISPPYIDH